jgi:hypothetical protein
MPLSVVPLALKSKFVVLENQNTKKKLKKISNKDFIIFPLSEFQDSNSLTQFMSQVLDHCASTIKKKPKLSFFNERVKKVLMKAKVTLLQKKIQTVSCIEIRQAFCKVK